MAPRSFMVRLAVNNSGKPTLMKHLSDQWELASDLMTKIEELEPLVKRLSLERDRDAFLQAAKRMHDELEKLVLTPEEGTILMHPRRGWGEGKPVRLKVLRVLTHHVVTEGEVKWRRGWGDRLDTDGRGDRLDHKELDALNKKHPPQEKKRKSS